jgi:hypothetical protein
MEVEEIGDIRNKTDCRPKLLPKDKIMKKNRTGMRLCKMTQNIKLIGEEVEVSSKDFRTSTHFSPYKIGLTHQEEQVI